ncbi:hypothetical protein [Absidia glauca]|uniref:Uncharacterized protein n=1 Tax=Absidia glauca TaxID=4829 RepID=A0A168SVB8_ABSGL|nr:hypothetical protein [Absidia glauca]
MERLTDKAVSNGSSCRSPQFNSGNSDSDSDSMDDQHQVIAYADDLCIFVNSHAEYLHILQLFLTYGRASNAKLNVSQTQAFSLTGAAHPEWQTFLSQYDIHQWFDKFSSSYLTYLGYPLLYTHAQSLLSKIHQIHGLLSLRRLTYRDKVTARNSIFSSKLWHILRLVPSQFPSSAPPKWPSFPSSITLQKCLGSLGSLFVDLSVLVVVSNRLFLDR